MNNNRLGLKADILLALAMQMFYKYTAVNRGGYTETYNWQ